MTGGVHHVFLTVNDLARSVREAVGGGPEPRYEAPRKGDVMHSAADLGQSQRGLSYAPSVALADGLSRSLDHYRRVVGTVARA